MRPAAPTPRLRFLRIVTVAGTAIATLGVSIAVATPHQFTANEQLDHKTLNGLNVVATDAGSYSVGATLYCGLTPATPGDLSGLTGLNGLSGYAKAKRACETACQSSLTAHVCTTEEVTRSAQLNQFGALTPQAFYWYASFSQDLAPTVLAADDCAGFTAVGTSQSYGAALYKSSAGTVQPNSKLCSQSAQILCCD